MLPYRSIWGRRSMEPAFCHANKGLVGYSRSKAAGFSMIELMVTVAVLAILAAIATPSFTAIINNNRLTSNANELVASLQLARSDAVTRNTAVTLCRSEDSATCVGATNATWTGWITVVESTGVLLRVSTVEAPIQVSASPAIANNTDRVVFRADGMARNNAGALLEARMGVCLPTGTPAENQRLVNIVAGSRVAIDRANGAGACPAPANN